MSARVWLMMAPGDTRERTARGLEDRRIAVDVFADSKAALAAENVTRPDVAVVELDHGDGSAAEICRRVHATTGAAVIGLGHPARVSAVEVVRAGADDFVPSMIGPDELVARVRALLRRIIEYRGVRSRVIRAGEVVVDRERHAVSVCGRDVALTPREFDLLCELARGAGELMRREDLLAKVWGLDESISTRTLDVHIARLRRKIERDPSRPELIVTVPRVGYRMAA